MRIRTIPLYLLGRRQAILDIAADPRWLWVGLLFVLSAGFAREYDGTDLRERPGVLLRPLMASTAAALVLYAGLRLFGVFPRGPEFVFDAVLIERPADEPRRFGLVPFLALFWMTAPAAWLYAVPVERFLDPLQSTAANFWFLASVAAWRVLLMIRVAAVIGGCGHLIAAGVVLLTVDVPVLVGAVLIGVRSVMAQVANSMAGIHPWQSETDLFVRRVADLIGSTVCWTVPVVFVVTLAAISRSGVRTPAVLAAPRPGRSWPVFALAFAFLAGGVALLPFFQPEQQRRTEAERLYEAGRLGELLAELSAHSPADYPPHWEPPPRIDARQSEPMAALVTAAADGPVADWVRQRYFERFRVLVRHLAEQPPRAFVENEINGDRDINLRSIVKALRRLPDGPDLTAELRDALLKGISRPVSGYDLHLLRLLVDSGLLDNADAERLAPGKWTRTGPVPAPAKPD